MQETVYIIAEAGVNHNGDLERAMEMVAVAKWAGADAIKFQTFHTQQMVSRYAERAAYQKVNMKQQTLSQQTMLEQLELTQKEFEKIKCYAEQIGIEFLSTPFDLQSIEELRQLGMKKWKIPSGELTNLPYLVKIAELGEEVILSTGMSDLKEIKACVQILRRHGAGRLTVLQCHTAYPTPYESVNLKVMETLKKELGVRVGYSDHTQGIAVPIGAVACGACVIEKHFTLDHTLPGPDHVASLEPKELKAMIQGIRQIEKAMGDGQKKLSQLEQDNQKVARKSIVATKPILAGEKLTLENIGIKRPGTGISPMKWYSVLGQLASRDFEEDELIE